MYGYDALVHPLPRSNASGTGTAARPRCAGERAARGGRCRSAVGSGPTPGRRIARRCPHLPGHFWRYDLRTDRYLTGPDRLPTYPCRVVADGSRSWSPRVPPDDAGDAPLLPHGIHGERSRTAEFRHITFVRVRIRTRPCTAPMSGDHQFESRCRSIVSNRPNVYLTSASGGEGICEYPKVRCGAGDDATRRHRWGR